MKNILTKSSLCLAAATGAIGLFAGTVISGDHAEQEMSPEQMMQMMEEMAAPVEQHVRMQKMAGEWTSKNTHWMAPGAPPETNEATITYKPIMGGRYLIEKTHGTMDMGGQVMEWEGMNLMAYDKMSGKHKFCWIDSMGTGMFLGEGEESSDGNTVTYYTHNYPSWTTGEPTTYKSVSTVINDNKYTFAMFEKMKDGSWFQNMEIVATRKGHSHADAHSHSH